MADDVLKELLERKAYSESNWQPIRDEAETDMRFVGGDPWDDKDRILRKGRPTIAPEEMAQYFNHVINNLRANPRGMNFTPVGNGANDDGARWYQNKAREVEYRSHAEVAYLTAAENAIQRSYGYCRLTTKYSAPTSPNQEVWIESIPDPDKVLLDFDAKEPDASDMRYAFVFEWGDRREIAKARGVYLPKKSRSSSASSSQDVEWMASPVGPKPDGWVAGDQELLAEYWALETTPRQLLLIRPPAPPPRPMGLAASPGLPPAAGPLPRPALATPGPGMPSGLPPGLPPPGLPGLPPGMPPPNGLGPAPNGMPALNLPAPGMPPLLPPRRPPPPQEMAVFADHYEQQYRPRGWTVVRELRMVDDPVVKMYLTDGLDILHEQDWPGKYIPIVSCYGKVLYVPQSGQVKRQILSMTRFGRDPWKAYCYCCSQELEVLSMVPKSPIMAVEGQLGRHQQEWEESVHTPKSVLFYLMKTAATGEAPLPPPQRLDYVQGEYLQALELVKEGYRRAIQAAMGSNFLPTQAQRRNEKSGRALDKIDAAAAQGTYHFIYNYESMIRRVGVIFEDLAGKIYDYQGETGTIGAGGEAQLIRINDPTDPDSVSTQGDYLVTVSSAPSSESERDAAEDFTDTLVQNIGTVAQLAGPQVASAIFARSIRMRNLGPMGDAIADLIEPPAFKSQTGKPVTPEVAALQGQVQHLTQLLQQAKQMHDTKAQELQSQQQIVALQESAENERARANNETKLAVATLQAKFETLQNAMTLFAEERARLGTQQHERVSDALDAAREVRLAAHQHVHESAMAARDASHEARQAGRDAAMQEAQQQAAPVNGGVDVGV